MRRKIDCLHICANVMWQNGDCMNITTTYKYRFTALYISSPCSSHSELSQSPPGWQWHPSILALLQPACLFDYKDVQQTETICTSSNIQACLRNITAIDNWLLSFCRPASKHTSDWGCSYLGQQGALPSSVLLLLWYGFSVCPPAHLVLLSLHLQNTTLTSYDTQIYANR